MQINPHFTNVLGYRVWVSPLRHKAMLRPKARTSCTWKPFVVDPEPYPRTSLFCPLEPTQKIQNSTPGRCALAIIMFRMDFVIEDIPVVSLFDILGLDQSSVLKTFAASVYSRYDWTRLSQWDSVVCAWNT